MELRNIAMQLDNRRKRLGLSCAAVADRAGIGLRTVQRALSGRGVMPELGTMERIAHALGASIALKLHERDIDRMKEDQAKAKAKRLVALTQGTSGLEAQAVPAKAVARMVKKTTHELLSGSPRKLWAT